jgi:hypothetical protein
MVSKYQLKPNLRKGPQPLSENILKKGWQYPITKLDTLSYSVESIGKK